jgi:tyrosyl-tRNA synthetase
LAEELTDLVHGVEERRQAESAGRALFGKADLDELNAATLRAALAEAGLVEAASGQTVTDLLVATGLCTSKSAARRTVSEGGAYLNNARIEDPELVPERGQTLAGEYLVLRRGKRHVAGVRLLG